MPLPLIAFAALQVATFRADVTPPLGEPNIWVTPVTKVDDPLWAKGLVLQNGRERYVVAALDWCGVGGATHRRFREALARGAGTDLSRVVIQSVHQHAAPYVVENAYTLLPDFKSPPLRMSAEFLDEISSRLAAAARDASRRLQSFDRIGTSQIRVERVASARRIVLDGGGLVTRYSTGAKDKRLAELPEGDVDPMLRTITFARGKKPVVRLHFYATHPQTFCCDGRVSSDFVGIARDAFEQEEGAFQIYFTGSSGDVTVGKYNDASDGARAQLTWRLRTALSTASRAARYQKVNQAVWRDVPLELPAKPLQAMPAAGAAQDRYRAAIQASFAARNEPLQAAALDFGRVAILFLPGEPMLAFQRHAFEVGGRRFVAVSGYGDMEPGYLCTDEAFRQGGYEPGASGAIVGTEALVKEAITRLLGR